jgi:hypothetical protein
MLRKEMVPLDGGLKQCFPSERIKLYHRRVKPMNGASEYLGLVLLGTVGFVVISLVYEGVKRLFGVGRK